MGLDVELKIHLLKRVNYDNLKHYYFYVVFGSRQELPPLKLSILFESIDVLISFLFLLNYITRCMQLIEENKWYNFDDNHISPISEDDVRSNAAYVLFYRRVRTDSSSPK